MGSPGVGHHQVIYGGGDQALRTVPINRHGRPTRVTTATYRIVDLRLGEDDPLRLIDDGNASLDATSTTTTAACGLGTANARKVPLTSVVGFSQGRHYLIEHTDGTRELFSVEAVGNSYVTPRNELARKFESGVTVRGIEVSCTFPALEAAKEESLQDQGGPYAVDWAWDLDPSPKREIVFLVRRADGLLISEEELLGIDPTLVTAGGTRGVTLTNAIRQAAMEVRALMQASQIDPSVFHGSATAKLAVGYRAAWHLLRSRPGEENTARAQASKEESQKYLDNLLVGQPPVKSVKVDLSTDSAPAGSDKQYKHWQVLS